MTTMSTEPTSSSHKPEAHGAPSSPGHTHHHPAPEKKSRFHLKPEHKRRVFMGVAIVIGLYCTWFLADYWMHEETDDAYVTGHMHYVSSRVAGVVQEVRVDDNQLVKEGDVLVKLDPNDLQAEYDEAKANTEKARLDFERNKELFDIKAVAKQELEHAENAYNVAKARLDTATLQLGYTTVIAPAAGRVGRKNVETGNRIQPGQTLMVIVNPEIWVVANYKETQLPGMKIGSKVHMTIDAIPGHDFIGTIDSFSPASGNQFALLPADNSTGNFTKIAQRVPVKIVFDPDSIRGYENRIRPGLSVVTKIRVH